MPPDIDPLIRRLTHLPAVVAENVEPLRMIARMAAGKKTLKAAKVLDALIEHFELGPRGAPPARNHGGAGSSA